MRNTLRDLLERQMRHPQTPPFETRNPCLKP
jgi:hypothetical protein